MKSFKIKFLLYFLLIGGWGCLPTQENFEESFIIDTSTIILLETLPDGTGSSVDFSNQKAGDTVFVFAVLRDLDGKFVQNISVSWTVDANIGNLISTSPNTFAQILLTGDGRTTLAADAGNITATSTGFTSGVAAVTVNAGTATKVIIETAVDGSGTEVTTRNYTAGNTETFHAVTRDAHDNFVGVDASTVWSVGGSLGDFSASPASSTLFTAKVVGTNTITANSSTLTDDTSGNITVTAGAATQVKLETQNDGNGSEITTATHVLGETINLFAVTRDAFSNFVAVDTVNWSTTGSIGSFSPASGNNSTFTANSPGSGVITGDHASLTDDSTGTITTTNNLPVKGNEQIIKVIKDSPATFTVNSGTDADASHTITYSINTAPASGTLTNCMDLGGSTGGSDLSCSYTPQGGFSGRLSFTYRLSDSFQFAATDGTVELFIQNNNNTWMNGTKVINESGAYGTQGVADVNNLAGARAYTATWVDGSGNFWLFGGEGYDEASGAVGHLNDLWRYNPSNGESTWMLGSKTRNQNGVYFTTGTLNAANLPGSRYKSAFWRDTTDKLYMFGGNGYDEATGAAGYLNDLWYYDVGVGQWAFLKGSKVRNQAGTYGTKGVAASGNTPGSREFSYYWIDSSNNLWLFGGFGYDANGALGELNDLWKFNGTDWAWIGGEKIIAGGSTFGTQGTPSVSNIPSARYDGFSWVDSSNNLWLFGGFGYPESGGTGYLADLWKYDTAGNTWTYIKGPKGKNQNGVYGTVTEIGASNAPGGRRGNMAWVDSTNSLWLLGGQGLPETGTTVGDLNDLWVFNTQSYSQQWTYMKGNKTIDSNGVYGTINVEAVGNFPGARRSSASWYRSSTNDLWLFGGFGFPETGVAGYLRDFWRYDP